MNSFIDLPHLVAFFLQYCTVLYSTVCTVHDDGLLYTHYAHDGMTHSVCVMLHDR